MNCYFFQVIFLFLFFSFSDVWEEVCYEMAGKLDDLQQWIILFLFLFF